MMRRLLETVIIEAFEHHGIAQKIQKEDGNWVYLSDLIAATLSEPAWNLGRSSKQAFARLKQLGDQSAHSRRFVAHREDVERVQAEFRVAVEEMIYVAGLK
jgi:hypothetical protein